uniref:Odorant receptor n=1 Tax=Heliconius melpomene rosina TaxID=171916 RepID=A0A1S5XXM6_HELME|nr:olfactory receptor 21 [Heliconius melpomene rosina]
MKDYLILKKICKKIFLVGSGNFWYEESEIGNDDVILYKIFNYILFLVYALMTLLEIMAALIGDFPEDEKSDSVTFAVSHTIVMIKIFSVIWNKELVKKLIQDLISVCEIHEEEYLMKEKYNIMKINVIAYFITVYGSAACFVFEGLRKMLTGSHFVTAVTYYPSYDDNSLLATITRIFMTMALFMMMLTMIVSVDCFAVVILIMYKYKFITLKNYFQNLRLEFEAFDIQENCSGEKLLKGLIDGIIMHEKLLRISKDIDKAFGTVMALQLCQSSGSAVSLLLQIALSDQLTPVTAMKILFFVIALFFLLGLFLCNAGEITYQASLLSDSIFYCGWHLCPSQFPQRRNLGRLVLQACAQAQRPLVMKAFKMLELTYGTFLLVIRGTYSVFALFYAQNQ